MKLNKKFKLLTTKEKRRHIFKYGVLSACILLILVLCVESLMPGEVSSQHSNIVGNLIDFSVDVPVPADDLTLSTSIGQKTEVSVGSTITLTPVFEPSNTTYKQVEYHLSDQTKAHIEGNVITFIAEGTVTVTVTSKYNPALTDSKEFTVNKVAATAIKISNLSSLSVGKSVNLTVTVTPSNATDKEYTLSTDSDCVTLQGRVLTVVKAGSATIKASLIADSSITHSITVNITDKTTSSLDFYRDGVKTTKLSLQMFESADLSIAFSPATSTVRDLIWSVDGDIDISFRSLTEFSITANSVGVAVIKATLKDNEKISASVTVTTTSSDVAPPSGVITELIGGNMTVIIGEGRSLEFTTVTADSAKPAPLKYEYEVTEGNDIISVNSLGLIKALKKGNATVMVSALDSDLQAEVNVTVTDLLIDSITLTKPTADLNVGKEYNLSCEYSPKNASVKNIVWSVSNSSVATVTQSGVLKFLKAGAVTVTVTAEGGAFASMELSARNVLKISYISTRGFNSFSGFTQGYATATLKRNGCAQLNVVFPSNATYKSYEVLSSDESVLQVEDNTVTALDSGTATITIKYHDGDENNEPIIYTISVTVEAQKLSDVVNDWMYKIRKGLGHFAAFFVLGVFVTFTFMLFIKRKWLSFILTFATGFFIACLTELLQLITPNRGPSFADVLLDFQGFSFAAILIIIGFIIWQALKRAKDKKTALAQPQTEEAQESGSD